MTHDAYFEVDAESHADLGGKLGELFGATVQADIEDVREIRRWREMVRASEPLLRETEKHFPQYIEELASYADAAKVPLLELWALSLEDELDDTVREKCTTVVTNEGRLISHNEDWDKDARDSICILKKTIAGLTIFELYYFAVPLGGSAISVNSHGSVQAINSLPHIDWQTGVPKSVIARWLSETVDPASDIERLKQIPRSSGYNHILVSPKGGIFDLECTATKFAMLPSVPPHVHTNHYIHPDLIDYEDEMANGNTRGRYKDACKLAKPQMTIDEITALNSDAGHGKKGGVLNKNTIGRAVIDFSSARVRLWLLREKKKGWVDYPLNFLGQS